MREAGAGFEGSNMKRKQTGGRFEPRWRGTLCCWVRNHACDDEQSHNASKNNRDIEQGWLLEAWVTHHHHRLVRVRTPKLSERCI